MNLLLGGGLEPDMGIIASPAGPVVAGGERPARYATRGREPENGLDLPARRGISLQGGARFAVRPASQSRHLRARIGRPQPE